MGLGLGDFEGVWSLDRVIEGDLPSGPGRVEGHAWFTPAGRCLRYVEEGELRIGGARLPARQEHLWWAEGGCLHVSFADGRAFHSFDPAEENPAGRHDCPPDLYVVRYDFSTWPSWSAEWRVTGPAKDYRVRTAYRRVALQS